MTLQALPHGSTTTDTFTYTIEDGHHVTSSATVTVKVTGGINHPPVAVADTASTSANAVLQSPASVLGNDTDIDTTDLLSVTQLNGTTPLTGTSIDGAVVTINGNGAYTYDPTGSATLKALPVGMQATDTFTYTVDDGHGGNDTGTVSITVTGVNDPPIAVNDGSAGTPVATTTSDTPLTGQSTLFANDSDPDTGDTLSLNTAGSPTLTATTSKGAAVTINADGSYTYDPTGSATLEALGVGAQTTDSFTYTIDDGHGETSTATVSITVTGVNDPPTATDDGSAGTPVASTASDTPLTGQSTLFGNDSDPDTGDTLSLKTASTTSAEGATVTVNSDGTWSYDPTTSSTLQALTRGQSTTDTFTYSVKDNHAAISNTATVTVGVTGVNHPPVGVADTYSTPADTTLNDGSNVLTNDTDAEGDTLTAILVSGPSHADAFTLNSDGTFSYTPETGFTNTDTFTYKANDGTADSTPITVTINVGP